MLGVELRPERVQKATWLAEVAELSNVRFEARDLFEIDTEAGPFDLVFCLGVFYHLENPMGALRLMRGLTRTLCVLEGQVAQGPELQAARGMAGTERMGPGIVVLPSDEYHAHRPGGVVFIPTLPALQSMLYRAGFRDLHLVLPAPHRHQQYQTFNRVIIFAYV